MAFQAVSIPSRIASKACTTLSLKPVKAGTMVFWNQSTTGWTMLFLIQSQAAPIPSRRASKTPTTLSRKAVKFETTTPTSQSMTGWMILF